MPPSNRYAVPAGKYRAEEEIKGSRFITSASRASTIDEAEDFISLVRREFPGATHNCWAYLVGPPGSTAWCGSSDDGEPAGTAGRPMLSTLLNSGVGDVVVVVTRYFGGIKLGKGGLVRAYSGGVKRLLKDVALADRIEFTKVRLRVDYSAVDNIRRLLEEHEGEVDGEWFGEYAAFELRVPAERLESFESAVRDLTKGRAKIDRIEN